MTQTVHVDAEDEAWDALNETQAMRCCDCPSCNYYLPEGEYKPDSACVVIEAIERIIGLRVARALNEAADHFDQFDVVTIGETDIGSNMVPVSPADRLRERAAEVTR